MTSKQYYETWKAKKLASDPNFFKQDYQKRVARYGRNYLNAASKKWREKHPEYHADYRATHKENHFRDAQKWREVHKVEIRKINREWSRDHPKIQMAQSTAYYGRLGHGFDAIPLADFCETCPDDDKRKAVHSHHPDYDYPQIIVSCCKSCHFYLNRSICENNTKTEKK